MCCFKQLAQWLANESYMLDEIKSRWKPIPRDHEQKAIRHQ